MSYSARHPHAIVMPEAFFSHACSMQDVVNMIVRKSVPNANGV